MSIYIYKNGIIPFSSVEDYTNLNEVLFRVTADTIEALEYIGETLALGDYKGNAGPGYSNYYYYVTQRTKELLLAHGAIEVDY
jgi:hypothetical protein